VDHQLDELVRQAGPWFWPGAAGMMGRLMFIARQVQRHERRFWSLELLADLPIALGMGWLAHGISTYFALIAPAETSAAITAAYLGPRAIDSLFWRWADRKFGTTKAD
jgi:hypothetical protein